MHVIRLDYWQRNPTTGLLNVVQSSRQIQVSRVKAIGIGPGSLIDSVLLSGPGEEFRISPGNPTPPGLYDGNFFIDTNIGFAFGDVAQTRLARKSMTRIRTNPLSEFCFGMAVPLGDTVDGSVQEILNQPTLELLCAEDDIDVHYLQQLKYRGPFARQTAHSGIPTGAAFTDLMAFPVYGRKIIDAFGSSSDTTNGVEYRLFGVHAGNDREILATITGPMPPTDQGVSFNIVDRTFTWLFWAARSLGPGAAGIVNVGVEARDV